MILSFLLLFFVLYPCVFSSVADDFDEFSFPDKELLQTLPNLTFSPQTAYYNFSWQFTFQIPQQVRDLQFQFPLITQQPFQEVVKFYSNPVCTKVEADGESNTIGFFPLGNFPEEGKVSVEIGYIIECRGRAQDFSQEDIGKAYSKIDMPLLLHFMPRTVSDPTLLSLGQKIVQGESSPYKKAYLVYLFLVKNMSYREIVTAEERRPLLEILRSRRANCWEMARVYTALCQSVGVVCRQVNGVVFGPAVFFSKDINKFGHSWIEVYIPYAGWIWVDPTFGLTRQNFFGFRTTNRIIQSYGESIPAIAGILHYNASSPVKIDKEQKIELEDIGEHF